jgi:hypothetical protein
VERRSARRAGAGRDGGAVEPPKAQPWSLGLRFCCQCGRLIGLRVWPWSGKPVVETHGYCERCSARLLQGVAETPVPEPPAAGGGSLG